MLNRALLFGGKTPLKKKGNLALNSPKKKGKILGPPPKRNFPWKKKKKAPLEAENLVFILARGGHKK